MRRTEIKPINRNVLGSFVSRVIFQRCFHHPIFVVGTGRSGTSVLLQALGQHPMIVSMPGEAPLLTSFGGIAYLYEYGDDRDYYAASLKLPKTYLYEELRRLAFETSGGRVLTRRAVVELVRGQDYFWKKQFWCAKTFPTERVTKGLLSLYPSGKFVYILRNGIDVVQSMTKFSGFRDREFTRQCKNWSDDFEKYQHMHRTEAALTVRHEDLVNEPETVFAKVFSFLEVPASSRPIEFIRTNLVHPLDKPTQSVHSVGKVLAERKPAHAVWNSEQKEAFKTICSSAMSAAGYPIPF